MGMAVRRQFGHLGSNAARGVQLRHDRGSCIMAEYFQTHIRACAYPTTRAMRSQMASAEHGLLSTGTEAVTIASRLLVPLARR
jgi:hypothetical protein